MVAPVLDKGETTVDVYFPLGDDWIDLWTGQPVGTAGQWQRLPAPLGQPAVLLRSGSGAATDIPAALKSAGVL